MSELMDFGKNFEPYFIGATYADDYNPESIEDLDAKASSLLDLVAEKNIHKLTVSDVIAIAQVHATRALVAAIRGPVEK